MTREEKDKLLKKLNQMLEKSNEAISIWVRLMENDKYPKEDCLKQINISNQQKEAIIKMIEKYDTGRKRTTIA